MILVFGQSGQVATELGRIIPDAVFLDRVACDLSKPSECVDAILYNRPKAVINAAAYTAVDKAETEEELATIINGAAPTEMARTCEELRIPLVHISTDYVFDGTGTEARLPNDPVDPVNAYGRSKLAGEAGIRASGCVHAIMRTSWVFSSHGNNFVKTMLRLSETRDTLNVVADQIGGPTPARDIAYAANAMAEALIADPTRTGTYHFSGAPDVSWADFAREIFRQAGRNVVVNDIPTADFPTPAKRPLNSRMDCESLRNFTLRRPDWKAALTNVLEELEVIR
ncbi:dTDP-4-dehydrorhamnose reductase [Donghicola sp. C2-DW-16]|uniref:dTDP-4-dehydrorhamnose reductase n=1 Tax=Donghicola mangrovi TaxID=2729614 RepID=A0ABX2PJB2_9RHOB|nr:dTDP-4-dehydrorhamnose reductase [Donghicola mangrovi]NVO29174.1 dTDP-4-dehydrorhamnose reductase [Donghicola mangrovi]